MRVVILAYKHLRCIMKYGKETHIMPHYYCKNRSTGMINVNSQWFWILSYQKQMNIERNVNHTDSYDRRQVTGDINKSKVTLSFIINGKEIDNSSIYSVRYIENGTEKPLVSGKVINGIRTRWALTNEVKVGVLDSENYKA